MSSVGEAASEELHAPQVAVLVLMGSPVQMKTCGVFGVLEVALQLYGLHQIWGWQNISQPCLFQFFSELLGMFFLFTLSM